MPTRFLSNDDLWQEIQTRVVIGKRVRAAIAYLGRQGATLLPLKRGDSLVVDLTIASVRQGVTDPREVQKLVRRGVRVFSRGSLHAKFLLIDKTLICSSANVSNNSKYVLDEAGVLTTDPAARRRAADYFDKLCTEPVGPAYLKKCIAEYRPPNFKAAAERDVSMRAKSRRAVEAKLWFVGGLVALTLSDAAQQSIEPLERKVAKKLTSHEHTEVRWIRYGGSPKFLRHLRVGDWIVDCVKDRRGRHVGPPSRVLEVGEWRSPRGARYEMIWLESPVEGKSVSLSVFRKRVTAVRPELNRPNPRTRAIKNDTHADAILRLWDARGRSR